MKNAIIPSILFILGTISVFSAELAVETHSVINHSINLSSSTLDERNETSNNGDMFSDIANIEQELVAKQLVWINKLNTIKEITQTSQWQKQNSDSQASTLLYRAKLALSANNPEFVIQLLTHLTKQQRQMIAADFYLALAYSKTGNVASAKKTYELVLAYQDDHVASLINLALIYKKQSNYQKVIELLSTKLSIGNTKKKAKSHAIIASSYRALGDINSALKHYKKSLEYRPNSAVSWLYYAQVSELAKSPYQQVVVSYERAASLAPSNHKHWLELGVFQREHLDLEPAFQAFSKAHKIVPDNIIIARLYADSAAEVGAESTAIKVYRSLQEHEKTRSRRTSASLSANQFSTSEQELVELANDIDAQLKTVKSNSSLSVELTFTVVRILERLSSNNVHRQKLIERAINLLANLPKSYRQQMATIKAENLNKNEQLANALVDQLLHENLYQRDVLYLAALQKFTQRKYSAAQAHINSLLDQYPNHTQAILLNLDLALAANHYNQAKSLLKLLSSNEPLYLQALEKLGNAAFFQTQYQEAREYVNQILLIMPEHEPALVLKAKTAIMTGQNKQALKHLNLILSINSASLDARHLLLNTTCQKAITKECQLQAQQLLKLEPDNQLAQAYVQQTTTLEESI